MLHFVLLIFDPVQEKKKREKEHVEEVDKGGSNETRE